MNILPLHSIPRPHLSTAANADSLILVNVDHVRSIEKDAYYPNAGDAVEGSKLYLTGGQTIYTLEVKETRMEILTMLEGPGKHSCRCKQPTPETSHV